MGDTGGAEGERSGDWIDRGGGWRIAITRCACSPFMPAVVLFWDSAAAKHAPGDLRLVFKFAYVYEDVQEANAANVGGRVEEGNRLGETC